MKKNDRIYTDIINSAFHYSKMILKNDDEARDISQAVAIEYFMNINKCNINNLNGWIFIITRNKCYNYIKKNKRNIISGSIEFNEKTYVEPNFEENNCNNDDMTEMIKALPSDVLKVKEKMMLIKYYNNNCEYKKLCARYSIKIDSMRKKIYRLKNEVIAYNKRKNGYNNTIKIVGPRLRENIMNFVRKFNNCCRNDDFSNMQQYLIECIMPSKIPSICIKKIIHINIEYIEVKKYDLCIIYYDNFGKVNSFSTIFKISKSNIIHILEFPKLSKKIFKANVKALPKEVLGKILPDKKGKYHYTFDEIIGMIKEHTELTTVTNSY